MVTSPLGLLPSNILVGHYFEQRKRRNYSQNVTVDFDTGSGILFLPGPSCPNCTGHNVYNSTQSSTAKDLGKNSTISYYGGGEVKGELFTDNISAGGLEVSAC